MVIIDKDTERFIKKLKIEVVVRIIISTLLFIGLFVTLFIFQNRKWQTMFVILLTLLSTLYFAYLLFVLTQYLRKIRAYDKFVSNMKHSSKIANDVIVLNKEKDSYTLGFKVKVYFVKEIDNQKEFYLYIDEFHKDELKINKTYSVISYHSVLIQYEEKNNETHTE